MEPCLVETTWRERRSLLEVGFVVASCGTLAPIVLFPLILSMFLPILGVLDSFEMCSDSF